MKKSTLLMVLSLVLALALGVGGTMAYLQDTDSDVNVMTLGNVYIVQNEQEFDTAGNLVEFTQDKPLYPYVGTMGWKNTEEADGAYRQFTMNNVVDKYVTVTNTGKSDAYVRTFIALEMGDYTEEEFEMIGVSINAANGGEFKFPGAWVWGEGFVAEIDGNNYYVMVAEHQDAVKPEETTIPSLNQIYLKNTAGNEEVEKLDGNGNGKYDVLVLSQAVQTQGFADTNESGSAADEALAAAFPYGENKPVTVAGWFGEAEVGSPGNKYPTNNPPMKVPDDAVEIDTFEELKDALNNGGNYLIVGPIEVTATVKAQADTALYNRDPKNALTFASGAQMSVEAGKNLTLYGVEIDGEGSYVFEDETFVGENIRTAPVLNVKENATLTLDGGTHIENVVAKTGDKGVIYAKGSIGNPATVVLKNVTIEDCAGASGTIVTTSTYANLYIEEGALIQNNVVHSNANHGIIKLYGSSGLENHSNLIMNGGVITGNKYSGNGVIGLYRGDMIMNGGKITGNSWFTNNQESNSRYGLIYVHNEATFTMNGGEIMDNTLPNREIGAIDCNYNSARPGIFLNAGTIKNNFENDQTDGKKYDITFSVYKDDDEYCVTNAMETSGFYSRHDVTIDDNGVLVDAFCEGTYEIVPNL